MNKSRLILLNLLFFVVLWDSSMANAISYVYDISSDGYMYNGEGFNESLLIGTAVINDNAIIDYRSDGITPEHILYNFTYRTELDGYIFEGEGAFNFLVMLNWGIPGNFNEWADFGTHDSAFLYSGWETADPYDFHLPEEMWNWDINYPEIGNYALNSGGIRLVRTGVAPVPEPATILLFGAGLAGFVVFRRNFFDVPIGEG